MKVTRLMLCSQIIAVTTVKRSTVCVEAEFPNGKTGGSRQRAF